MGHVGTVPSSCLPRLLDCVEKRTDSDARALPDSTGATNYGAESRLQLGTENRKGHRGDDHGDGAEAVAAAALSADNAPDGQGSGERLRGCSASEWRERLGLGRRAQVMCHLQTLSRGIPQAPILPRPTGRLILRNRSFDDAVAPNVLADAIERMRERTQGPGY